MEAELEIYLHCPHVRPSICTLRTAASSLAISVSSSHGLTSSKTEDLPTAQKPAQQHQHSAYVTISDSISTCTMLMSILVNQLVIGGNRASCWVTSCILPGFTLPEALALASRSAAAFFSSSVGSPNRSRSSSSSS